MLIFVNVLNYRVIEDDRVPKLTVYDFINDRLRSVKQDGIVQRMSSVDWFKLLPPIIRFYSYSAYWSVVIIYSTSNLNFIFT